MFGALFIINPNVTVEYLRFDIIFTDELVGESSVEIFFINGTMPPLVVQSPYHSMYWLVITTGNVLDNDDTMDITFNLTAFINTNDTRTMSMMLISNVTLHKIGKMLLYDVFSCH